MVAESFARALSNFFALYNVLLLVRILLSWFPNIDWYRNPWAIISQLTDPYLNIFRSFVPPLGGIDFSPILAILLLQFGGNFLVQVVASLPF